MQCISMKECRASVSSLVVDSIRVVVAGHRRMLRAVGGRAWGASRAALCPCTAVGGSRAFHASAPCFNEPGRNVTSGKPPGVFAPIV